MARSAPGAGGVVSEQGTDRKDRCNWEATFRLDGLVLDVCEV